MHRIRLILRLYPEYPDQPHPAMLEGFRVRRGCQLQCFVILPGLSNLGLNGS